MNTVPKDPARLNHLRRMAVRLRQQGKTLREVRQQTGLSAPTVISACKLFAARGWAALDITRGGNGEGRLLDGHAAQDVQRAICTQLPEQSGIDCRLWSVEAMVDLLRQQLKRPVAARTVERYLERWQLRPPHPYRSAAIESPAWLRATYPDWLKRLQAEGGEAFWAGVWSLADGRQLLSARSKRGTAYWLPLTQALSALAWEDFALRLQTTVNKKILLLLPSGSPLPVKSQCIDFLVLPGVASPPVSSVSAGAQARPMLLHPFDHLSHLDRLEAESLRIMREVVAEAENPVMLYSIGKDSSVMLHLAQKAFWPGRLPFPLLHIDTGWKFREMYRFRDQRVRDLNARLLVYINPEGLARNINPFTHGSAIHTDIMKTQALKQALDQYGFDLALGGARRDEERSRSKERVFSFRTRDHRWDPKNQRPELWNVYNTRRNPGESIRVFPLSNWTELDIWLYIHRENIPIVPLYFAAQRPVVERGGKLIVVDDERMPLMEGEQIRQESVRFRTLGCYPLSAAIRSEASTLEAIIAEMLRTSTSERQGRLIDVDGAASMEKKKQEGYF